MLQNIDQNISKPNIFTHLDEAWFQKQLVKALPSFIKADKFTRMCRTELKQNVNLQKCDPLSVTGALIQSAELGLVPASTLGQVYLIPRFNRKKGKTQCQMMVGYRGMLELARRSGQVKTIHAFIVYANDTFKIKYGFSPSIDHIPSTENRGDFKCVYAVATLKSGEKQFEMMTRQEVLQIKAQAKKSEDDLQNIWEDHFDEMARKTVIRRLFKYLPVSLEMNHAIGLDEQWERAEQDNDGVIETSQSNIVSFPALQIEKAPQPTNTQITSPSPKQPSPELQQFVDNLAKFNTGEVIQTPMQPKTAFALVRERLDEQRHHQHQKGVEAVERLKTLMLAPQNGKGV
jgi:recombination protein RecT